MYVMLSSSIRTYNNVVPTCKGSTYYLVNDSLNQMLSRSLTGKMISSMITQLMITSLIEFLSRNISFPLCCVLYISIIVYAYDTLGHLATILASFFASFFKSLLLRCCRIPSTSLVPMMLIASCFVASFSFFNSFIVSLSCYFNYTVFVFVCQALFFNYLI